jgi:predicted SnoaL-like aldol condensation-catalyzing enzyme
VVAKSVVSLWIASVRSPYWDLFRVADEKIVEHWDAIPAIPAELPHTNGLF